MSGLPDDAEKWAAQAQDGLAPGVVALQGQKLGALAAQALYTQAVARSGARSCAAAEFWARSVQMDEQQRASAPQAEPVPARLGALPVDAAAFAPRVALPEAQSWDEPALGVRSAVVQAFRLASAAQLSELGQLELLQGTGAWFRLVAEPQDAAGQPEKAAPAC